MARTAEYEQALLVEAADSEPVPRQEPVSRKSRAVIATKLVYLALRAVQRKWQAPPRHWHQVRAELAVRFGERFVVEGS